MKLCSHEGCGGKVYARSLCSKHYIKWRRTTTAPRSGNDGMGAEVLKALATPGTTREIAQRVGCSDVTARLWLYRMRGTKVHISAWKHASGPYIPVWSKGKAEDAPCTLVPMSRTEIQRRHREKVATLKAMHTLPRLHWLSPLGVRA